MATQQVNRTAAKQARSAAEEFATQQRGAGFALDFSAASIRALEMLIDASEGLYRVPASYSELRTAPADTLDFVARAGAYLGEVTRRHAGGEWATQQGRTFPFITDAAGRPGNELDPFRVIFDAVGAGDGGIIIARYTQMGGRVPDAPPPPPMPEPGAVPPPVPGMHADVLEVEEEELDLDLAKTAVVARPAFAASDTPFSGVPVDSDEAIPGVPLKLPLGEILVAEFDLARERVEEALKAQAERGGRIGDLLVAMRATTEEDVLQALSRQIGSPFLDNIELDDIEAELTLKVPIAFAKQFQILPLRRRNGGFEVAVADPTNVVALDDMRLCLGGRVYAVATPARVITSLINKVYDRGAVASEVAEDLEADFVGGVEPVQDIDILDATDEAPIIRLINSLLYQAAKEGASDIHIEPMEREILVRFRVDGKLREVVKPPKKAQNSITSRVKIMAGLNIAEKRLPQDGRIRIRIAGRDIDIRVSTTPTSHGEGVVMRLLDRSTVNLDLGTLGFTHRKRERFEELISAPNGIILVTGPTGSGKTTTLYAALTRINRPDIKILTIEDPIEYQLKGTNQVQVNPKIDLTFASALRSFLRQDPDVILVGEIRDPETAEVAIQASLTGHLVLSTVHTRDAPSAVTRLVNMGIEPFLVSSTLIGVMAQRLVRVLCQACRVPYTPKAEELSQLGIDPDWFFGRGGQIPPVATEDMEPLQGGEIQLYHPRGCSKCNHTGYSGRTAIYELARVGDEVQTAILRSADGVTLRKVCIEGGMRPLRDDGALKALHGVTTLEEVISVTAQDQVADPQDLPPGSAPGTVESTWSRV